MEIGERLRELRNKKDLSQGDIEKRTGLLRCYVSRVENGFTVPSVETLEKFARALEAPLYQLFYDGTGTPEPPKLPKRSSETEELFGAKGKDADYFRKLCRVLAKSEEWSRALLLHTAQKMAK